MHPTSLTTPSSRPWDDPVVIHALSDEERGLTTHVRGTIVAMGWKRLRDEGRESAYWNTLAPALRAKVEEVTPLSWVPCDLVRAHCEAFETVLPEPEAHWDFGHTLADSVQGVWLRTVLRTLRVSGKVTTFLLLRRAPTAWRRIFRGGGVAVHRDGVRSVRLAFHGLDLIEVPAFRRACGGLVERSLRSVEAGLRVELQERESGPRLLVMRAQW